MLNKRELLGWLSYKVGVFISSPVTSKVLSDVYDEVQSGAFDDDTLQKENEGLKETLETAIMFLQGNELFVKAEQIKRMRDEVLNSD